MAGLNKIMLIGNLGQDPDVRHLDNGRVRVSFSLATNESYKNKAGDKVVNTEWHNIVIWSPGLADIAERYLRKGMQVYLEGKVTYRSYDDKEGNTRYTTEIIAREFNMLENRQNNNDENSSYNKSAAPSNTESAFEEDKLPF